MRTVKTKTRRAKIKKKAGKSQWSRSQKRKRKGKERKRRREKTNLTAVPPLLVRTPILPLLVQSPLVILSSLPQLSLERSDLLLLPRRSRASLVEFSSERSKGFVEGCELLENGTNKRRKSSQYTLLFESQGGRELWEGRKSDEGKRTQNASKEDNSPP